MMGMSDKSEKFLILLVTAKMVLGEFLMLHQISWIVMKIGFYSVQIIIP